MRKHLLLIPALGVLGFASACTGNRVADGALIGAGGGAAVGQVVGRDPVTGALIGAAGGAVVGAVTDDNNDRRRRRRR